MIEFFIPGEPAPQGSKKHVGNGRLVEMSKKLPVWRQAVKEAAAKAIGDQDPINAPVHVTAHFFMPKPKKPMFPVPATAPDADKLARALNDGLEGGGLLKNDARIVQLTVTKSFGEPTGAYVTIEEITLD